MLQLHNVQVYNLTEALIASGNAMRTELVDTKALTEEYINSVKEELPQSGGLTDETNKGLKRCIKLTQAGLKGVSCHSNYLTGILVSFDVVYPCYWSPESQRYHWFNIVTSSSKMHRLCKMRGEEYFNKYTDKRSIAILQNCSILTIHRFVQLMNIRNPQIIPPLLRAGILCIRQKHGQIKR